MGEDCKLGVCCGVEGVVCEFGGGVGGEFRGGVKVGEFDQGVEGGVE